MVSTWRKYLEFGLMIFSVVFIVAMWFSSYPQPFYRFGFGAVFCAVIGWIVTKWRLKQGLKIIKDTKREV